MGFTLKCIVLLEVVAAHFFGLRLALTTPDLDVLIDFKKQVTGDPNGILTNWSAQVHFCNWTGVTCHPKHPQRVQALVLYNQGLHGTLTASLGKLEHLEYFSLAQNNFHGHIPKSIGNCTRLKELDLSQNYVLTGAIPSWPALPQLQTLELWGNRLQGQIPPWIPNCTALEHLELGRNRLSGNIPTTLCNAGNSKKKLKHLGLQENRLSGVIPFSLLNCSSLEVLKLSSNYLHGSIPQEIGTLHKLQQIYLWGNLLSGNIPESISNLTFLFSLYLADNKLTGEISLTLGPLTNIQRISLTRNNLSGGIPAAALKQSKHLGYLALGGNKLEGHIPPEMGEIQSLNELYLWGNRLTGEIPRSIGNLSRLQHLNVSSNQLYGLLPDSLERLATSLVKGFDISSNNFQGEIPAWIGAFDKVVNMSLASNNFSGVILSSIKECKGLISLNMSSNQLSGNIPSELGELQSLRVLDLSINNLSGPIPTSLTALRDLVALNFSRNNLQGPIPLEGVFSKLNSSSFFKNPLLCGPVVNISCPSSHDQHMQHQRNTLAWLLPTVALSALLVVAMVGGLTVRRMRGESSSVGTSPGGPLKVFSLEQLLIMTNNFDNSNFIGQGGYSNVFKASWEGKPVAVKVMKHEVEDIHEMRKSFLAETKTLTGIRHRNIVKLFGYCCTKDMLALVMEYMPNGSLRNYLATNTLNYASKLNIAVDVAQAVYYIHHEFDVPLIHCDLKPDNVLLDFDSVAKITDFGISKLVYTRKDNTVSVSKFRGTIGYTPPEYAYSSVVSTTGDVFSYGMLLLVMTTGKSPGDEIFHESGNLRNWVLDNNFDIEGGSSREKETEKLLIRMGLLCTNTNPADRPTMKEILAMFVDMKNSGTRTTFPPLEVLLEEEFLSDSTSGLSISL